MAEPHELLDPNYRHHNPLYWIECRPDSCPVNNFRVNQWIVCAFPPDHESTSRLHVTEPVGPLAKGEGDHETIRYRTRAQRRGIGATGTPSTMMNYGKHRQAAAPGERQHERIEASYADAKQSAGGAVNSSYNWRLLTPCSGQMLQAEEGGQWDYVEVDQVQLREG